MRFRLGWLTALAAPLLLVAVNSARAVDYAAVGSGNWSDAATWTPSGVPGASDNASIGSTAAGAAATATVSLGSTNESISTLFLGAGGGTSGTLNLGTATLTAGTIFDGWYGPTGVINNNGGLGSFTATNFYIAGLNSYSFGSADAVANLTIQNNAQVTTSVVGNVTGNIGVNNNNLTTGTPATLNLGAALNLSGNLDVENGGVVAAGGHDISANTVFLGWYGTAGAWSLTDRGNLTATNLYVNGDAGNVAAGALNLTASDHVTSFTIFGSGATTTFAAGATVANLAVENNAQATTVATGNITNSVDVNNGNLTTGTPATLNLGAALNLTGNLQVENGGVVNANGHDITAGSVFVGWYGGTGTIDNPGVLTATNLYVSGAGNSYSLGTSDVVTNLTIDNNGHVTTSATGNVTNAIDVNNNNLTTGTPATLTLGAALNLSGNLSVENGGVVNANGHGITASTAFVGWFSGGTALPATVNDVGPLVVTNLYMDHGSSMTITGGTISTLINLQGDSTLTVQQLAGQTTGLTFLGTGANLNFDPSSIDLHFADVLGVDWDFRWQDPATGGNWVSEIDALIASGNIVINSPHGYSVYDSGGYTYIGYNNTAVPEPSSLALCGLGALLVGARAWRRRKAS